MKVIFTNNLTKKKEIFYPINNKKVNIYVCGITPYDYSHIGHGRCYVNFDVLVRLLKFLGYKTTYVRNFTDIDDKILNRAEKEFGDINKYKQISEKFIKKYHEDMQALNCLPPDYEPKVTEYIEQIIKFIKKLIESENAYVLDGDVYFDVCSFKDYGKLSGKKLEDLRVGARIDVDNRKKNPYDFVLWKGNKQNLFWKSPWGYGRPGWHIECSVLVKEIFNGPIDIHGGGMDLIFPHHENEIAQSECYGIKPFAKYWIHNAFININKEKMSKSLGNFFTLRLIFEKFDPMILRFYFLKHYYRTPIEFTLESLNSAKITYEKITELFENLEKDQNFNFSLKAIEEYPLLIDLINALSDDLNTPKFFGIIFENLNKIKESKELLFFTKHIFQNILGLTCNILLKDKPEITPEIEALINQREDARKNKNWALADQIRNKLIKLGYEVKDKKIK